MKAPSGEVPNKYNSMTLRHSVAEGPEYSVFYRGTGHLCDGEAEVELPHYFESLTKAEGRTVQLTAVGSWSPLVVKAAPSKGTFWVCTTGDGQDDQSFDWRVDATRNDEHLLTKMHENGVTDAEGHLIPERWKDTENMDRESVTELPETDLLSMLQQYGRSVRGDEDRAELIERVLYH